MSSTSQIDSRCLEMGIYDYFKYCYTHKFYKKGVGVITDKQTIFYSQILDGDFLTHEQSANAIEKNIHPNMKNANIFNGDFLNNIHMFSLGRKELIIDLPPNGDFSMNQYRMLSFVLDQVDRFNKDFPNEKVDITIFSINNNISLYNSYDVSVIKNNLKKMVTKSLEIDDEVIIGQTLNEDDYLSSIEFQSNIFESRNIHQLIDRLDFLYEYYNDDYYKEYLLKVFPNFINVYNLLPLLRKCENIEITNVNFENVQDILLDKLELAISRCDSFSDLSYSIFNVDFSSFSNLSNEVNLFSKLISFIDRTYNSFSLLERKRLVNCFRTASDIRSLLQNMSVFTYCNLEDNLFDLNGKIQSLDKKVDDIEIRKRMIENKDELSELFKARKEIKDIIRKCIIKIGYLELNNDSDSLQKEKFEEILLEAKRKKSVIENKCFEIIGSKEVPIMLQIPDKTKKEDEKLISTYNSYKKEKEEVQSVLDELKDILMSLGLNNQEVFDSINNSLSSFEDHSLINDDIELLTY